MLTPMLAQILIAMAATYLWLYLNGNEYTVITGGWVSQAWSGVAASWSATAPSLSKGATSMTATMSQADVGSYSGVVRVTNKVDLSAIATIRITLSAFLTEKRSGYFTHQMIYLLADDTTTGDWAVVGGTAAAMSKVHDHAPTNEFDVETLTDVQYALDVSALSGTFYVCIGLVWLTQARASTVTIKAVEMIAG